MAPRVRSPSSGPALHVVARLLRPVTRQFATLVETQLAGSGLTLPTRAVLERLYEAGPQTVPQIARALAVRRQFVQRSVDGLVADGWLERGRNEAHKRSALLRLTLPGRVAIEQVLERESALLDALAATLDADDVEAATRVLQAMAAALQRADDDPPAGGAGG